jgi:D-psicose/D-tagatose/L-ribulose 3-epimerase
MKYGVHCYIFTERWSDGSLDILDTVRELGADCIEIAVGDDVQFTPALTRRRAEALGLELIVSPGGEWPAVCDLSADDAFDRSAGLAWHKQNVDLAAEMGASAYTGALYGHPGTVQRRMPPADEYPRTAEGLHRLAEHGAQSGVVIVIEPMSHFRTHVANTPEQIMRLIALADHPNLRVLLDTYHLITEIRDYRQAVLTVGDRLWGLHACENDRGVPGGGLVPWERVFTGLGEIGFAGYLILEAYNSSLGDFA